MNKDDLGEEFKRLREIGERNRVTLSLLKNWCAHAEVVSEGSGGLFQATTGLPIAMCRVTCKHERATGSISMHLDSNALHFYDRNCVDCDKRVPVGFPNLSHLVGERDRAREEGERAAAERQRAERDLLEERARERTRAFTDPTSTQKSLLTLLDQLDRAPSDTTEREFVAGMRAVGDVASDPFLESIVTLIRAGGSHRVRAGLLGLDVAGYNPTVLGELSLEALARREAVDTAADLALRNMAHSNREKIKKAAPALLMLAGGSARSPFEEDRVSKPEVLEAAHRIAPDIIQEAIVKALASESKLWRRAGCFATLTLMDAGLMFDADSIVKALVDSLRLPDDIYYDGPAYATVAWTLSQLLVRFQDLVGAILINHEEDGDERVRVGVFRAYTEVFRGRDLRVGRKTAGQQRDELRVAVEEWAFERITKIISVLPEDERLNLAVDFLRGADKWLSNFRATASAVAQSFLGIAAVACERAEAARKGSSVILDPRPAPLRELDLGATASRISNLASEALNLVAHLAREQSDARFGTDVVRLVLDTLRGLPSHADAFRSALVAQLGSMCRERSLLGALLPEIYSAMTHSSVRVRSAANTAYADVCRQVSPEVLPSLLHESFLIHLRDPYVAVHRAALRALQKIKLPQPYRQPAFDAVVNLVEAYRAERERRDEFLLADALSLLLRLAREEPRLAIATQKYVIAVARTLSVEEALHSFVRESAHNLQENPGFGDLVLALRYRGDFADYQGEFMRDILEDLPRDEVIRVADRIVDVGLEAAHRSPLIAIPFLKLLDRHGQFEAAHRLATAAVRAGGSDRSKLPDRLKMAVYAKALEIENALGNGKLEDLGTMVGEIRRLETEIEEDDRLNHERRNRDVFP